jgi:MFS family permease
LTTAATDVFQAGLARLALRVERLVPRIGRRAWRLLAGFALAQVGVGLTLPFLIIYLNGARGFPLPIAGLILACISLGGVLSVLSGGAIDRFGAGRVAVIGLLGVAAGTLGLAAASEPGLAALAAVGQGFGQGSVWNALSALYAEAVPPERRGDVFGVNYALLNLGLGIGAAISAAVLDPSVTASFGLVFVANAVCLLIFAALLVLTGEARRPRVPATGEPSIGGGYRTVLGDRALLAAAGVNTLLVIVAFGQLTSAFAAWASQQVPNATSVVGWAWTANTFTITLAQLFVLRLVEGRRRTRCTAGAALLFGTAWLMALGAGLAGGTTGSVGLVLALAVFGLGETLLSPSLAPMVNDLAPGELRGRYNAVFNLSWQTGLVLGPALAGVALGQGWAEPFFVLLAACCGLAALLVVGLERLVPPYANRRPKSP